MKQWEIIADILRKAGWSLGWVSALDVEGRTMWIVDAHGYGKRFIVRADEMLTAFLEVEVAIWTHALGQTYVTPRWVFPWKSGAFPDWQASCQQLLLFIA